MTLLGDAGLSSQLSEEERHVANVFLTDFEKSAIHLPARQREQFVSLSDETLALSTAFSHNLHVEEGRLEARIPLSWLKELPADVLRGVRAASETREQGKDVIVPADSRHLHQIIRYAPDGRAREAAYRSAYASGDRQRRILEALLLKRAELAALTGHKSFAHLTLKDKLAKSPGELPPLLSLKLRLIVFSTTENVVRFLEARLAKLRPAILDQERKLLRQDGARSNRMQAWDRDYLLTKHLNEHPSSLDPLSTFFSVGTVFSGLSRLFSQLFGIYFRPVQTSPSEVWTKDVLKLQVIDEDAGGPVGNIYADLWSRPGKPMGAAHFTVRCSRRVDLDDTPGATSDPATSPFTGDLARTQDREGLYQQPIVALLCDFRKPSVAEGATFLQWSEVETLVHEMGHAIHCEQQRSSPCYLDTR